MPDYIPTDTLIVGFIAMLLIARAFIVHDVRETAIYIMRFVAGVRGESADIKQFESFGGFWPMYFDLRKWFFGQFYPGVGE
jgi:hypothetical protein